MDTTTAPTAAEADRIADEAARLMRTEGRTERVEQMYADARAVRAAAWAAEPCAAVDGDTGATCSRPTPHPTVAHRGTAAPGMAVDWTATATTATPRRATCPTCAARRDVVDDYLDTDRNGRDVHVACFSCGHTAAVVTR